jgi:hypothetical protein
LNNTRLNYETVAALAHMTGRVLAVPETKFRGADEPDGHGMQFRPLHPHVYFRPLPHGCINAALLPQDVMTFSVPHFEPDTTVFAVEDAPGIEAFAAGRRVLRMSDEMRRATVLRMPRLLEHFYAFLFGTEQTMRFARRHVRDHVRHPPQLEQIGERMARSVMPFHAVAIRRGDFIQVRPEFDIPAAVIADRLAETMQRGERLVIASDEPDRAWFAPLMDRYDVRFAGDIVAVAAPSHWSRWWRDCAEQIVCAYGVSFLGTRMSTYSSYVCRLRGYYGLVDRRVRFTCGRHNAVPDGGAFSWEAARRAGDPMWGREFEEGWTV